jgi:arylsulfatase
MARSLGPRTHLWALVAGASLAAAAAPPPRPPNVVVILADDLGFSDLGCYGSEIDTPHLDALAAGGLRFTQGYNTARCWPSRAALLTGYYPQSIRRDALPGGEGGSQGRRPAWARLLPQLLEPAGYRSYHCGKWHVDGAPLEQGFATSLVVTGSGESNFFDPAGVIVDGRPTAASADFYATTAIGDHAVACLAGHARDHAPEPFFLYLPFTAPHFPLHAPQDLVAKYLDRYRVGWDVVRETRAKRLAAAGIVTTPAAAAERDVGPPYPFPDAWRRLGAGEVNRPLPWTELTAEQREFQAAKMAIHAAMVEAMDREVGRVVAQLREMHAFDDTLVLFASDNGASAEIMIRGEGHDPAAAPGSRKTFLCLGPGWSTAANTPFRRHKTWTHEGGIATPWIVHWPRGIVARGELRQQPVHLVDVAPTVLELAGVRPPREHAGAPVPPMQGRSFAGALATATAPAPHEALWWCHEGHRAVRVGDWKLVAAQGTPWELYDLARDRCETNDLAAREPDRVADLQAAWQRIADECQSLARPAAPQPRGPQPAARSPRRRPNIIYVMTDDQGYGDIAAHGNPLLVTPHLDRLHGRSVRLTEFHASPTCSPSRAALLTGRHEFRSGVTHTIEERERLALAATTLPHLLNAAGYACGIFGKWHLGDEDAYQPGRRGFDRVFIHGAGGIGQSYPGSCGDVPGNSYLDPVIRSDGTFVKAKGYCTDVFFTAALAWIDRCRREGTPFFCYLTPNAPHGPLVPPPGAETAVRARLAAAGAAARRPEIARFYAMIENIDGNMGRLLDALREGGIAEETIVVFTTDNGTASGASVCNDGMRGAKGSPYRGGTRVPSFWHWPGTLPEGVDVPAVTAHIDVLPTFCELAGVGLPEDVEGRSLVPLLRDAAAPWPDRMLVTHLGRWDRGRAATSAYANCRVREGRWQLVNTKNRRESWELYDVSADPGEARDVAAAHPDVVARLAVAYDAWWDGIQDDLVNEEVTGPAENPFRAAYRRQRQSHDRRPAAPGVPGTLVNPGAVDVTHASLQDDLVSALTQDD